MRHLRRLPPLSDLIQRLLAGDKKLSKVDAGVQLGSELQRDDLVSEKATGGQDLRKTDTVGGGEADWVQAEKMVSETFSSMTKGDL